MNMAMLRFEGKHTLSFPIVKVHTLQLLLKGFGPIGVAKAHESFISHMVKNCMFKREDGLCFRPK